MIVILRKKIREDKDELNLISIRYLDLLHSYQLI
jgi:hypothetical protein